ncbi:MAG: hypothetical protein AAGD25_35775 [Cyanobacteria bacterium P01_F01_bin.150]
MDAIAPQSEMLGEAPGFWFLRIIGGPESFNLGTIASSSFTIQSVQAWGTAMLQTDQYNVVLPTPSFANNVQLTVGEIFDWLIQ